VLEPQQPTEAKKGKPAIVAESIPIARKKFRKAFAEALSKTADD
jgi:hypothetical protein